MTHDTADLPPIEADPGTSSDATQFELLTHHLPVMVAHLDRDLRFKYANAAYAQWVGLTPETLRGRHAVDVVGEDAVAAIEPFARRVLAGEHVEYEAWVPYRNRGRRYMRCIYAPEIDRRGQVAGYVAGILDETPRKAAEDALRDSRDRLRSALDASNTGTFRWQLGTDVLEWDGNLARLFGLAGDAGPEVRELADFLRLVHPEDRDRVVAACQRCVEQGADFEEEFRVPLADGSIRWLFDKGRLFTAADGTRYMTGACVDITQRRTTEDALRVADRQKDEFLGMLAHEIRNPLAPIVYAVASLERQLTDAAPKRAVDVIGRQVQRMVRIVDDLLDVSRVTQGKISLQREYLSLQQVLTQCVETTRPDLEARRHTVALHPVEPGLEVFADPVRLAQIFENLLVNAGKYTPDGGRIEVAARTDGDRVAVSVTDSGIGMGPDLIARAFDLFAQADTSLHRSEGGLGIGLTLVERLTALHGGAVEARSAGADCGSTFVVRLPLAPSRALDTPTAPPPASTTRRRVLVVDDNVDGGEMLQSLLGLGGHEVSLAHDGLGAVASALACRPEVILLDIGLPGKDGYEVLAELRAQPSLAATTIIATTGYGRPEDRARCLAAGFDDHLTKPLDPERVAYVVSASRVSRTDA